MRVRLLFLLLSACSSQTTPDGGGVDATLPFDSSDFPESGGPDGSSPDSMTMPDTGPPVMGDSVLEYHKNAHRDGAYVQPALTKAAAANMKRVMSFDGTVSGNVHAQPLFVESGPNGKGTFYVVTASNNVYAIDETTGSTVWQKNFGTPAPNPISTCGGCCGNIHPIGIVGTPVIDITRRAIFFDSVTDNGAGGIKTHSVHALSIDDGSEINGWPLDVSTVKSSNNNRTFNPIVQNQRGASIVVGNTLYVPYGAHGGDCSNYGTYYGWVVAIPISNPSGATAYATQSGQSGIWAPAGLSSDGVSIFAATGNAFNQPQWAANDSVLKLGAGATFSAQAADYYAPSNFAQLDQMDWDLSSAPVLFDVQGSTPSALALVVGKDRRAHLLDRNNLGGIGGQIASPTVSGFDIVNSPVAYRTPSGTYVSFARGGGAMTTSPNCPVNQQTGNEITLKIAAGSPPTVTTAWCAATGGFVCSPIATTTDGTNDPIVWTLGCEGSRQLRGFDGETGAMIFGGGTMNDLFNNVRHFSTPIAVHGKIYVAGDNKLYAYAP